jgi:hypothetical protein
LKFLDRDDSAATEEIFEKARQSVPMPEPPKSLLSEVTTDSVQDMQRPKGKSRPGDRKKFDDLT